MIRRPLWGVAAIVFLFASIFFAITTAVAAVACFGHPPQNDRAAAIAGAVILALITLLLVWLTRVTEHHARFGAGLRTAVKAPLPPAFSRRVPSRPVSPARLHFSESLFVLMWFGALVGFLAGAVSGYSDWSRSSETQSHGAREAATVTAVLPVRHSSRTGSWTTYDYDVTLPRPVHGHSRSVLYTPGRYQLVSAGQRVDVLVDPSQPSYAELPGQAMGGPLSPILLTVLSAAMLAATVGACARIIAHHRYQRLATGALGARQPHAAAASRSRY